MYIDNAKAHLFDAKVRRPSYRSSVQSRPSSSWFSRSKWLAINYRAYKRLSEVFAEDSGLRMCPRLSLRPTTQSQSATLRHERNCKTSRLSRLYRILALRRTQVFMLDAKADCFTARVRCSSYKAADLSRVTRSHHIGSNRLVIIWIAHKAVSEASADDSERHIRLTLCPHCYRLPTFLHK